MATRPKKILRGLDVAGSTRFRDRIEVDKASQFYEDTGFAAIKVDGDSTFTQDVTISSVATPQPNLTLTGTFINDQFFPLDKFTGTPLEIEVNAGIVIPGVGTALNKYYINRGPLPKMGVSNLTEFTEANGWGEWFSGSGGGPSTDVCEVDVSIATSSNSGNFVNDSTVLSRSIVWNVDNTGFLWNLNLTAGRITKLCDHTLTTGLPVNFSTTTLLTLSSIELNGQSIDAADLTIDNTILNNISITLDSQIENDNFNFDTTDTNTIEAVIRLGTRELKVIPSAGGGNPTLILDYTGPRRNYLSISTPSLRFDGIYTTATIGRSFNGNPTSFTSTSLPNATITAGATNITFPALNRSSLPASRTVTEVTSYTNRTNSSDVLPLTRTAIINPTFTFPVYLGNVTPAENASLSATLLNMTSRFTRFGNFTSKPGDQSYTWPNTGDDSRDIRLFAVATRFTNGGNITVRPFDGGFPSTVTREIQIALGDISGATENYDIYSVQAGSPGAGTLFIEL